MNIQQVNWASQHDWFICSIGDQGDDYIAVVRVFVELDGKLVEFVEYFDSYQKLREWAGY